MILNQIVLSSLFFGHAWAQSVEVRIHGRTHQPGEILLVEVVGQRPDSPPSGKFRDIPLAFFAGKQNAWLSYAGIDLDVPVGPSRLELELQRPDGGTHFWSTDIVVAAKKFPERELTVDDKYVRLSGTDQARADQEALFLKGIFSKIGARQEHFTGEFFRPIVNARSARFGERRVFNKIPKDPHGGADLAADPGTPVAAMAGGRVVVARGLFYQGNAVIVDHGFGLFSAYYHLSKILISEGQAIKGNAVLGEVGATGRVTGPHLHWSVKWGSTRIDPFSLLFLELKDLL